MSEAEVNAVRVLPEEMREWKQHPCTLAFLFDLQERVREGKEDWAAELFQDSENAVKSAMENARALGGMRILKTIIDFLEGTDA